MEVIDKIKKIIQENLFKLYGIENIEVNIEKPKEFKHGDYSSNVAMQICKSLGKAPREIAVVLIEAFKEYREFDKVEIAGPGFINFYLNILVYQDLIEEILDKKDDFGKLSYGQGKKINVEFVSANPTGSLHIGHARQAALGDSICRLYQNAGYQVTREFYVNDAGNQIHNHALSLIARYEQLFGKDSKVPEDGYHGEDLIDIAKIIKNEIGDKYLDSNEDEKYHYFREEGTRLELNKIKSDLAAYRTVFDIYSSEKKIRDNQEIEKVLEKLKSLNYLYEQDGATWFRTTEFKDDKDRVLIKSDGSYTYLAPDIAYHLNKLNRGYDYLIDLLGADHHGYIIRMKAAIMALGYQSDQLDIELVQMVRLIKDGEEFKMSKRSGKAVTILDFIEEVGADAARFIFVSRAASSHLDIDIDLLQKETSENPVFYVQYAHARICSVVEGALKLNIVPELNLSLNATSSERTLLQELASFERVVLEAATTKAPYKITLYVQNLATTFHLFYNNCRIIDENNLNLSKSRLSLCESTRIVLRNALKLIGVEAPQKM